jgi:hypothetical protein
MAKKKGTRLKKGVPKIDQLDKRISIAGSISKILYYLHDDLAKGLKNIQEYFNDFF